ncbi:MAG: PilZ domain-containing protein [Acidimicrobiales bacterium]
MITDAAPRLVRKLSWAEADLVEGTETMLWPAGSLSAADTEELPGPSSGVPAVLSWVRPKVIRFETVSPEPLPELLLASTLAVGGPAQFVVRKSYQMGNTAVCDPPAYIRVVERRDAFRIAVATPVTISSPAGEWLLHSMDCSIGGLRICLPRPLQVGAEVEAKLVLEHDNEVCLHAVVRHCHPYQDHEGSGGRSGTAPTSGPGPQMSIVGLQFLGASGEVERHLSNFVGYHQRRLMPRVRAVVPVEYRSHGRSSFLDAFAVEISPGDALVLAPERHLPGDAMELGVRLGRQGYKFNCCVLSCASYPEEEGQGSRRVTRVSFQVGEETAEAQFRRAVRELAIEKVGSRRR